MCSGQGQWSARPRSSLTSLEVVWYKLDPFLLYWAREASSTVLLWWRRWHPIHILDFTNHTPHWHWLLSGYLFSLSWLQTAVYDLISCVDRLTKIKSPISCLQTTGLDRLLLWRSPISLASPLSETCVEVICVESHRGTRNIRQNEFLVQNPRRIVLFWRFWTFCTVPNHMKIKK